MAHAHPHSQTAGHRRPLRIALVITAVVLAAEVGGGLLSRSLALLADAGHMLTDVGALGLSLFAFWLADRPASARHTFGWRRFEIFAAFLNGVALWLVAAVIGYEAFKRLQSPPPVKSGLMLAVAAVGLAANILVGAILFRGRRDNLNVRGAFLHVVGDALGSVAVLAAALLIALTGSYVWDPLVSAVVCLIILWSSVLLIRDSFRIFMEGTPPHLDLAVLRAALQAIDGVADVHDLHVWTITSGFVSMSAHVVIREGTEPARVLERAQEAMASRFRITHSTFQLESAADGRCAFGTCDAKPPTSA
jgi:cobalt-zinc-cadmium efflux system protein